MPDEMRNLLPITFPSLNILSEWQVCFVVKRSKIILKYIVKYLPSAL